jgi:hypothetical protein
LSFGSSSCVVEIDVGAQRLADLRSCKAAILQEPGLFCLLRVRLGERPPSSGGLRARPAVRRFVQVAVDQPGPRAFNSRPIVPDLSAARMAAT